MRRALTLALAGWLGAACAARGPAPPKPPPADVGRLQAESLSRLTVHTAEGPVEAFLVAEDRKIRRLNGSSCGWNEGAREVRGRWRLVGVRQGRMVGVALPKEIEGFIESTPHDGLHAFQDPKLGHVLLLITQYAGCNGELAWFFRVGGDGRILPVAFHDQDGREWSRRFVGQRGSGGDGATVFCYYDNAVGEEFCDAYVYDGARFVQIASWMAEWGPLGSCAAVGEARRTAWEFFGALWERDYSRAAYYYAGPLDDTRRYLLSDDREERARELEAYCTAEGGRCARLRLLEAPSGDTRNGTPCCARCPSSAGLARRPSASSTCAGSGTGTA